MSAIRFLADHDLNDHIVNGVFRREPAIEFVRVRDVGLSAESDSLILEYASREQFIVVSHDVNTMTEAASDRISSSHALAGLLMVPQSVPVALVIDSLILIWSVSDSNDWQNQIVFLPL